MNKTQAMQYLLDKPESWEDFPFGPEAAVYKIDKKMFALIAYREGQDFINLKCDPDQAFILRDIFTAVKPAYHMSKKHWNSVVLDGSIPSGEIERMIDHSYALVVNSLTKKRRASLALKYGADALYCQQLGG